MRDSPLTVGPNKITWDARPNVGSIMQSSTDLVNWIAGQTPVVLDVAARKAEFAVPAIPSGSNKLFRVKMRLFVEDQPALAAYEGFDYPTAVDPVNPATDGDLAANQGGTAFNSIARPDVPNVSVWGVSTADTTLIAARSLVAGAKRAPEIGLLSPEDRSPRLSAETWESASTAARSTFVI